jgi:hypothetical protein
MSLWKPMLEAVRRDQFIAHIEWITQRHIAIVAGIGAARATATAVERGLVWTRAPARISGDRFCDDSLPDV